VVAAAGNGEGRRRRDAGDERSVGGGLDVAVVSVLEANRERDVGGGAKGDGAILVGDGPRGAGLATVASAGASRLAVGNPVPDVEPRARVSVHVAVVGAVELAEVVRAVVRGEEDTIILVAVGELVHKRRSLVLSVDVLGALVRSVGERGDRGGSRAGSDRRRRLAVSDGDERQGDDDGLHC